jgi:hypothetical protein
MNISFSGLELLTWRLAQVKLVKNSRLCQGASTSAPVLSYDNSTLRARGMHFPRAYEQ